MTNIILCLVLAVVTDNSLPALVLLTGVSGWEAWKDLKKIMRHHHG